MESGDQQIPENPGDQQVTSQVATAAAKSYECTFCKRGFSNAQALGGHMNIHRKDKAKLKQVSTSSNIVETKQQQRFTLEIPKIPPSYSPILPKINPTIGSFEAINLPHSDHIERSATIIRGSSWPADFFNDQKGDNQLSHLDRVQQFPLFSQAPSDQNLQNQGGEQQQQPEVQRDQSEEDPDLDLELRLGPEPQDPSSTSAKATTRKFF